MTLQEIVGRFEGAKGRGDKYMAKCPCHADRTQSLSIDRKQGRDGRMRVMIHCHAGCGTQDILDRVGLGFADLVEDPDPDWKPNNQSGKSGKRSGKSAGRPDAEKNEHHREDAEKNEHQPEDGAEVVGGITVRPAGGKAPAEKAEKPALAVDWEHPDRIYSYTDGDGTELFQVVRYHYTNGPGKTFRQRMRRPGDPKADRDGWVHSVPEEIRDRTLYRMPQVARAIEAGQPVYVVEGEKDVETLERLGMCGTCNPGGAGKWRESYAAILAGADLIILPDNDPRNEKGGYTGQDHGYDVALKCRRTAKRIRLVNLKEACPELPEKGDVTDLMEILGDLAGRDALARQIAATKDFDPEMVPFWLTPAEQAERLYRAVAGYGVINGAICQLAGDTVKPLCDFVVLPRVEKIRDDGVHTERVFVLDGWNQAGQRLARVNVGGADLDSMNWLTQHWGYGAAIVPGSTTKAKVAWCIKKVGQMMAKTVTEYAHTGWRKIHGSWAYLYNGGAIGADGVTVNLGEGLSTYRLDGSGSPEFQGMDYRTACGKSLELLEITRRSTGVALLGTMFLAPLREFLVQTDVTPAFSLFLHGQTQTRKSTLAALAMSHFGNFHAKNAPANFRSTGNYITKKAFLVKDMPIWVDDFHPTDSPQERRQMNAAAQMLARAFGDGADRGRLNSDRSLQETAPPRSVAVITGEDLPAVGASGLARFYIVDVEKGDVPVEDGHLSRLQEDARRGWLQKSMEGYIKFLAERVAELPEQLHKEFLDYREMARRLGAGDQERAPEAVACIMIGYSRMLDYFQSVGAVTEEQVPVMFQEAVTILTEASRKQAREMEGEKPTRIFLDTLAELLRSRQVAVKDLLLDEKGPFPADRMVGYRDNGYYYLLPNLAFKEVSRVCREEGHEFPISLKALYKHLRADGMLPGVKDGENPARVKWIPGEGKTARVLMIPARALDGDKADVQTEMELTAVTDKDNPF